MHVIYCILLKVFNISYILALFYLDVHFETVESFSIDDGSTKKKISCTVTTFLCLGFTFFLQICFEGGITVDTTCDCMSIIKFNHSRRFSQGNPG